MQKQHFEDFRHYKIVLFDAECVLCNHWTQFLIRFDRHTQFKLASVQSSLGQQLLKHFDFPTNYFDTMLYLDHGKIFTESTAFLKIMQSMPYPWFFIQIGLLTPTKIRDPLYRIVAKNRYRWFGRNKQCHLFTHHTQKHFLNYYLYE